MIQQAVFPYIGSILAFNMKNDENKYIGLADQQL